MSKSAKDKVGGHHLEYYDPRIGWYTQRSETVRFHKRYHRREARREQGKILAQGIKQWEQEQADDLIACYQIDEQEEDLRLEQRDRDAQDWDYHSDGYYDYYDYYDDYTYCDDWYNSRLEQPEDRIIKPEDCGKSLRDLLWAQRFHRK